MLHAHACIPTDNLLIVSRDPQALVDVLEQEHKFKLKGTGVISFHLGCDFFRDADGVLCYQPKKYIQKCLDNYEHVFGSQPKKASSPLVKGDHPELDGSPCLDLMTSESISH